MAPANPLLALSGTVLESRYELGRVLGAGGMGAVFEATQLRLGRKVAIKVMRPGLARQEDSIKRFHREARIASEIRHRNVVEIHDFGEAADGLVYCVMELLHGQDLEQLLTAQARRRLPWDRALGLLLQVASGLRAAHAAGIVHRDIKPANCFVIEDDDGEPLVKVLDFGIAKLGDGEDPERLTSTAQVLGTPCYMAPELVIGKQPASARSDLYSLGVLAYRMLAGSVPFTGATSFQVLHRACFESVPPLRSHGVEVPRGVEALVMRMLAKTPQERPADVQEVRSAIVALLKGAGVARAIEIPASAALVIGVQPREAGDVGSESEVAPTLPSPGMAAADGEPGADGARGEPVTPRPAAVRSPAPRRPRKRAERVQLELSALGDLGEHAAPSPSSSSSPPPERDASEPRGEPGSAIEGSAVEGSAIEESASEGSASEGAPPDSPPVASEPSSVPPADHADQRDHADGLLPNGMPVPVLRPVERRPAGAVEAAVESRSRAGVVVGVIGVIVALAAGAYLLWNHLRSADATRAESTEPESSESTRALE